MKNQIKNISLIALLFAMTSLIISCQSKTDKFLDKYESITKTLEEKVKKGDKISSISDLTDMFADLAEFSDEKEMKAMEENLNGAQKSRLLKISARYADAMLKLQGLDTSKMMKDIQNVSSKAMENVEDTNNPQIENNDKKVGGSDKDQELSEYDKEILGTWSGTLSGSNLATKKLVVVFTKSSFNQQKNFGNVEGYSTVNNTNKTPFVGTFFCDADTPVLELNENKTSGTNGTFKISSLSCEGEESVNRDKICGTWISYNGQLQREVKLKRLK